MSDLAVAVAPVRTWPDVVPADNRTLGWAILEWTAEYLLQPDGPMAGEVWQYTPEQARIVLRFYEIDEQGRFVHRRGVIRRMKGHGKDPLLATLAAVELCGPCRFGGWDASGMPVTIQHPAPWVQVAAVNKDQTKNTFALFPGVFSPVAVADYRIDIGKEVIYARGVGRLEAVTSSPRALEGGRPSFIVANETQHWLSNNDGLAMMQTINRNLAKSRDGSARVLEITNAHLPDEGSAAELTYEAWRQADGQIAGVYYDSIEAPPIEDIRDEQAVKEGLLAARGDSTWVDVDRLWAEISDPSTPEWLSRRFYLNQVTKLGDTWLPSGVWEKCAENGPFSDLSDGSEVVLGFDGSFSNDSTALVVCSVGPVPLLDVVEAWELPPGGGKDWRVPVLDVEDAIRQACKRWQVREIVCDPHRWAHTYQVLEEEGLPIVEFPQNPTRMTPATERFFEAAVNGLLRHSGDPRLARHVANCVLRVTSRGQMLSKDAKGSPRKIDLAVAAVMALDRAMSLPPKRTRPRAISLSALED